VRLAVAIVLVGLVAVGIARLFDPSTWVLFEAMRALGPISGWRCAQSPTYTYDPRHERADTTLLSESPEAVLAQTAPGLEIEKVEADLRGGDAVLWTTLATDDGIEVRRVYVLSPGRLQTVVYDLSDVRTTICTSHMADWQVVGEHSLE
jgi:hypothetical protein